MAALPPEVAGSGDDRPHPEEPSWGRREPAWRLLGPVVSGAGRTLFSVRAHGLEHVPRHGPALVIANHLGHLDPVVLVAALHGMRGRRPRFLAREELFADPFVGWWLRRAGALPVVRGRGPGPVIDVARRAFDAGELVVMYPEGHLARGDRLVARPGAGAIALATGVPVVPLALWGMQPHLPGPPLRRPAAVEVGAPLDARTLGSRDPQSVASVVLGLIRARLLPRARVRCGFAPDHPDADPEGAVPITGSSWRATVEILRRWFSG